MGRSVTGAGRSAAIWRAAATLACGATAVAGALVVTPAPTAGAQTSGGSTSPTTLLPPLSTTTTAPPPTTAPASSGSTSTTAPPPKGSGVPAVPVGGPPTTAPPKGTPPPPPPDPKPILTAVQADLTQLTAITDYKQAQADVAAKQQAVTTAGAALQSAQADLAGMVKSEKDAAGRVGDASQRLEHLAIAAYIGLGYATPAAGPQGVGPDAVGTVSTPGGLTGTVAGDAQEMLRLVAQKIRSDLADTKKSLQKAQEATAKANQGVAQAEANVNTAQADLQGSQQTLDVVTKAATVPGAAAEIGLLEIPGGAAATEAPPTTNPGGSTPAPDAGAGTAATMTTSPPSKSLSNAVNAAVTLPAPTSPSILGQSMLTPDELAAWYASTGHSANATVPMAQLAADYAQAGQATGVRFDLAFAQSVVETGFFSFPSGGQLDPNDNNFAGIGACDTCAHGWSFPDAQTGISAQLELLEAYASPTKVATPLIGPVGVGGCCPTWMALAGKWASSLQYGISIMTVYQQMLAWVIPQRLQAAGLIAPTPATATSQGPSLAPLPPTGQTQAH